MRIRFARLRMNFLKRQADNFDLLGFEPFDHSLLPERLIVCGGASANPTITNLLSQCLGAPTFALHSSPDVRVTSSGTSFTLSELDALF